MGWTVLLTIALKSLKINKNNHLWKKITMMRKLANHRTVGDSKSFAKKYNLLAEQKLTGGWNTRFLSRKSPNFINGRMIFRTWEQPLSGYVSAMSVNTPVMNFDKWQSELCSISCQHLRINGSQKWHTIVPKWLKSQRN